MLFLFDFFLQHQDVFLQVILILKFQIHLKQKLDLLCLLLSDVLISVPESLDLGIHHFVNEDDLGQALEHIPELVVLEVVVGVNIQIN